MPTASQRVRKSTLKYTGTIAAGGFSDFDPVLISAYKVTDYSITIHDPTNDLNGFRKLASSKKSGAITHQVYSKGGDHLDISLSIVEIATDAYLRITNNEAVSVEVCVTRFLI